MKKNITIVGLGETGSSCVEYFQNKNIPITVIDSRDNPPRLQAIKEKYPNLKIHTGGFSPEILANTDQLIISPGLAKDDPSIIRYLKKDAEIIGDIELFARDAKAPIVAITGSNGKSTVTTLLGEMAKEAGIKTAVGGNLGQAALSLLDKNMALYVMELSSFQLETTYSLAPKVATILNLSPDHLDRYRSVEDYFKAKERIYINAKSVVANRDDALVYRHLPQGIPSISFGLTAASDYGITSRGQTPADPTQLANTLWLCRGETPLLALSDLKLFGRHNVANALAALALAEAVELPIETSIKALKQFTGLKHRCEWVRTRAGVPWINDSKGTNVGATQAALQGLAQDIPGKWVLIAGGLGKNADFSPLKPSIQQHCRAVILIGEAKEELQALLKDVVTCLPANSMEEAVYLASKTAETGDGVLLSPACASFDMFKNFEDRGEIFKALTQAIK